VSTAEPESLPRRVGLLGAGVIGGGWAARFALAGVEVRLFDPAPDAADGVHAALARARRAWDRLSPVAAPHEGAVTIVESVADAVADADLVQESAPEREALKVGLLAEASAAAPAHAIIATSTSGLLPSRLAADVHGPERFVVGHPFNPVYLLPLVELCGGERTSAETIAQAAAFYRAVGMRPLVVRHEIDGFIADRLLEALWREALWLVADDIATVEEVDDAIRFGAGLRWSAMGTFLTYRLAGGDAGMRHFMAQFGPTLQLPWTHLTDVPTLDDELLARLVRQSDAQAGEMTVAELEELRDDCLVAVLDGLRREGYGAGEVVAETERRWRAAAADGAAPSDGTPRAALAADGQLRLHDAVVQPGWIDYNGHMTEFRYLQVVADATDAFLSLIGAGPEYAAGGHSFFTVETHLRHLAEAHAGDRLAVTTRLLGHDERRFHLFHELHRPADGAMMATSEHMLVHVDTNTGRAAPATEAVLDVLARLAADQRELPIPEAAGRRIDGDRLRGAECR